MKATRPFVRQLREGARMRIDKNLEALILKRFGTEPSPHTYTEQDRFEQIRKLVIDYNEESKDAPPKGTSPHEHEPKGGNPQQPDRTPL
jgi:hypothetical protein